MRVVQQTHRQAKPRNVFCQHERKRISGWLVTLAFANGCVQAALLSDKNRKPWIGLRYDFPDLLSSILSEMLEGANQHRIDHFP